MALELLVVEWVGVAALEVNRLLYRLIDYGAILPSIIIVIKENVWKAFTFVKKYEKSLNIGSYKVY